MDLFYDEAMEWAYIWLDGERTQFIINTHGQIMNSNTGRILKTRINYAAGGYEDIRVSYKRKRYTLNPHKLVAENFFPLHDIAENQINHLDGYKVNNNDANLEWCTPSENIKHAFANNLKSSKGEHNSNCKHADEEIHRACQLRQNGVDLPSISSETGIPLTYLEELLYRKDQSWGKRGGRQDIISMYSLPPLKRNNSHVFDKQTKQAVISLINDGYTAKEICQIINIDYSLRAYKAINHLENKVKGGDLHGV